MGTGAMNRKELKDFLDQKAQQYNHPQFITSDPIQIPHRFSRKEDIEIAGFLAATIAWGNRKSIIRSANNMMKALENTPFDFINNASDQEIEALDGIVHRTFNPIDFRFFVKALKHLYKNYNGLEGVFMESQHDSSLHKGIHRLKQVFFEIPHPKRTQKHLADPYKGSAAKRIHMFLRWMVRNDQNGVDFGLWKGLQPAQLSCPLDLHSGNVARSLGLLKRKKHDHKAVVELDKALREMDAIDPVKYDFALFGLGVFESF
jgi:uncharacterized protein (TIGR02757 family)